MGRRRLRALFVILVALGLADCATERLTEPAQTATEQLLVSSAIDRAVDQLDPHIPSGTPVFVDAQYLDNGTPTSGTKYAVAAIRDHLLRQGARLMDDRKDAAMVVELRTGGQSIDHRDSLVGIPPIPVPVPLTTTVITTPKLALFENDRQTGIAKLALTAYDRKTGALTASTGVTYGTSRKTHWVVLLVISGTRNDDIPKDVRH